MEGLICLFVSPLNCKSTQSHLKGPVLKNVHNLYTVLTLFFNTEVLASNPWQNYKTQHEVWNNLVFPMPFMKSLSEEGYIIIIKDTHVKMQAQPKRRQAGEKVKGMSGHKTSIIRKFENYLKIHSSLLTQRRFQHHIHCPVQKTETNLRKIYYHKQSQKHSRLPAQEQTQSGHIPLYSKEPKKKDNIKPAQIFIDIAIFPGPFHFLVAHSRLL